MYCVALALYKKLVINEHLHETNGIEEDVLRMAPNAKSAPHIGGGHFYQWTRPEQLSDILVSFIQE